MSVFKFRLATLLKLRETTRDERRAELAEAYRVDEVLRGQLDRVGQEQQWLRERYRRATRPGFVNVDQLLEGQRYELVLKGQQRKIEGQRELVAAEVERRREALLTADREVRVLEKLRERQLRQHQEEEARREQKRLDEVAGQQALRRTMA